jgi:hypothetical protein
MAKQKSKYRKDAASVGQCPERRKVLNEDMVRDDGRLKESDSASAGKASAGVAVHCGGGRRVGRHASGHVIVPGPALRHAGRSRLRDLPEFKHHSCQFGASSGWPAPCLFTVPPIVPEP